MADTDKLVKVGQLDTIVDEIVDKFGETNGRLGELRNNLMYNDNALKMTEGISAYGTITGRLTNSGTVDTSLTTTKTTGFIPVTAGDGYIIDGFTGTPVTLWRCTYDAQQTFITYNTITIRQAAYTYTPDDGVAFVRFSFATAQELTFRRQTNAIDDLDVAVANLDDFRGQIAATHISTNLYNGVMHRNNYLGVDGVVVSDSGYCYTHSHIPVQEGDTISAGALTCFPAVLQKVCAYDAAGNAVSEKGLDTPALVYTVPAGIATVRVSLQNAFATRSKLRINKADRLLPYEAYSADPTYIPAHFENHSSTNILPDTDILANRFIRTDGTEATSSQYSASTYIPVHAGDVIYSVKNGALREDNTAKFRYVTAYDATLSLVTASGAELTNAYTVPEGIYYIRCTFFNSAYNEGDYAINRNTVVPYEDYYVNAVVVDGQTELSNKVQALKKVDTDILQEPLTTLPPYIVGNLWYKPLGCLTKPYICLVTDDGRIGMNTYTIPMVLSKGVPCTFAIMSGSEVMADDTNIDIVKNAITNGGCSVAQHGGVNWTQYTEKGLNDFFDAEATFFAQHEIPVNGAVIPSHYSSKMISALAGGRYGVVRSGFNGYDTPTIYYGDYLAGARSNLYLLPSYNFIYFQTLERNKQIIDYAVQNNLIAIIYTHETSLTEEYKQLFEDIIDYAKTQPIEFITLGDIATKKVI